MKKQEPHDDDLAVMLEGAADAANESAATPDWEELGAIVAEGARLHAAQQLDETAIAGLLARAQDAIPKDRPDVLADLEEQLRGA